MWRTVDFRTHGQFHCPSVGVPWIKRSTHGPLSWVYLKPSLWNRWKISLQGCVQKCYWLWLYAVILMVKFWGYCEASILLCCKLKQYNLTLLQFGKAFSTVTGGKMLIGSSVLCRIYQKEVCGIHIRRRVVQGGGPQQTSFQNSFWFTPPEELARERERESTSCFCSWSLIFFF